MNNPESGCWYCKGARSMCTCIVDCGARQEDYGHVCARSPQKVRQAWLRSIGLYTEEETRETAMSYDDKADREKFIREHDESSFTTQNDAAFTFMKACGLDPTPDAVGQLTEVFLPCLEIMCRRPWNPEGQTWRQAGRLGALADVRKKFQRLWERAWIHGKEHDDSAIDLINYVGFYLRADKPYFGDWENPALGQDNNA